MSLLLGIKHVCDGVMISRTNILLLLSYKNFCYRNCQHLIYYQFSKWSGSVFPCSCTDFAFQNASMNHQVRFCDLCPFFYCLLLTKIIWSSLLYNCHSSYFSYKDLLQTSLRSPLNHLCTRLMKLSFFSLFLFLPCAKFLSFLLSVGSSTDFPHLCRKRGPILAAVDQIWPEQCQQLVNHHFSPYSSHISSNIANYISTIWILAMEFHFRAESSRGLTPAKHHNRHSLTLPHHWEMKDN